MKTVGVHAALLTVSTKLSANDSNKGAERHATYNEPFRPQLHFTPPAGWMSDPCGMVYYKGEYHLHYQANPDPRGWGSKWAHALSKDLVHWTHQAPSLVKDKEHGGCWSGSAVVDYNNTAGFQTGSEKVLVLFFTKVTKAQGQTVGLAYSNDRGRTWRRYPSNPVTVPNDGNEHFRDPKVIWHEPSKRWIMVISRGYTAAGNVYRSTNLKEWELAGKAPNGECPDMFELAVPGGKDKKWLYLCGDYPMTPNGVGAKYFIGTFDGSNFTAESQALRLGGNFFVGQSFANMPAQDKRRIWMGWKWLKTEGNLGPWTGGIQTIPVELTLGKIDNKELRLFYNPARELQTLRSKHIKCGKQTISERCSILTDKGIGGELFECIADFEPDCAEEFGLHFRKGGNALCTVGYNAIDKKIVFRDATGKEKVSQPLPLDKGRVKLHLLLDRSVIDIFGNGGQTWNCSFFKADRKNTAIELYAKAGTAKLVSLDLWKLIPIGYENSWQGPM